ncbi:hypothetical protein [Erwinia phage Snitter]|nr:hypothetical protein [Erwinia phage Snitter]
MADNWKVRRYRGDVDDWIKNVEKGLEEVAINFLINVIQDLVDRSPVDTGRYRANWQVTLNEAPMFAVNAYDKSGKATVQDATLVIRSIFGSGIAVKTVYFSNMLIYANSLEYGHSKQAPFGVLGIVSLRLSTYMRDAIQKGRAGNGI